MNEINLINKPDCTVKVPPQVHAKMRIHCAKLGIKIRVWLTNTITTSIKRGE